MADGPIAQALKDSIEEARKAMTEKSRSPEASVGDPFTLLGSTIVSMVEAVRSLEDRVQTLEQGLDTRIRKVSGDSINETLRRS